MSILALESADSAAADVAGGAVGVPARHWFVALVGHNTEKSVAERLAAVDVECYLPVQEELRVWANGRRKRVQRVVIPCTVFVKCTEAERRRIVELPFVNRFMTDRAATGAARRPAIVPERQLELLRFMLGNSDSPVSIESRPLQSGDKVRVIRGKLAGLEGEVISHAPDRSELIVRLDFFGCARLTIDPINVEPLQ